MTQPSGETGTGRAYAGVRAFLAAADLRPEFAARALSRIEAQHDHLGDRYRRTSLTGLVVECSEEAEDLAAWGALVASRLAEQSDGSFGDRRARALLTVAAQRAGEAHLMLSELRRLLERAQ
jgi:hypothetical protein